MPRGRIKGRVGSARGAQGGRASLAQALRLQMCRAALENKRALRCPARARVGEV